MEKYISNYTGERIDAILADVASKVGQTDLETLKTELLARLQGTSASQDGYTDPIFTKEFANGEALSSLNTWLDNQFFAIKNGVYYRNGRSGTFTISKDVPQCLININFQGVKMYVFNAPQSFATGTFEQIALGVTPISEGGGIMWGSGICRRQSTYNFDTQQATWSAWESVTSGYVDEQRISYVSPCFADCAETHEAKLKSITLASSVVPFKTIFSVTIKIANNLTLLNQSPVYMHLVDLLGNVIGVSQNAVRQVQNKGKYVTWFFDSAINTTGVSFVIKLHTTNSASSASDSNLIGIIAHVSKNGGVKGSGVTSDDGTYHTDWTPAIGINVVNLAAIYPQIKELQKYRMAYATSELPDISTTGHKANIKEIRIGQNTMGISLVSSVSLMVASDNAYSGELYLKVHDINGNLVATSNNSVRLSQNLGKYVTWYFTPFQLIYDAIYRFAAWDNSGSKQVMRIHVASGKNEGITCFDQNESPHTDYCPALGLNVSAIFANDLYKSIKEVNIALGNGISQIDANLDVVITTVEEHHYDIANIKEAISLETGGIIVDLEVSSYAVPDSQSLVIGGTVMADAGSRKISNGILLEAGQKISSSDTNIHALLEFAGNTMGRRIYRVLQVGSLNYMATEEKTVYVCYEPKGLGNTVKVGLATRVDRLESSISDIREIKADKTYVNDMLATKSDKGLLYLGEVSSENDFFSRIATYDIATNPAAQVVTATYKSGSGTGTLVVLQQVRANISGDGGGTTMQYIYCNKRRYTRYIDFSATAIISVQSLQTEGVRNLQYDNGVLSLKDIWGDTIGSTVNLTSVDKTAIREGTSTTDKVQLTVTKPFGNTASAYISAATSAKAGIMTATMCNRLNYLLDQIGDAATSNETATQGTIYISTYGLAPGAMIDISNRDPEHPNLSTYINLKAGQTIEVSSYTAILVQHPTLLQALCADYGANISYKATTEETVYIYSEVFPINYVLRDPSRLDRIEARVAALEAK